jgi:hypothetical protein
VADVAAIGHGGEVPEHVPKLLQDRLLITGIGDLVSLLLFDFAEQAAGLTEEAEQRKCR